MTRHKHALLVTATFFVASLNLPVGKAALSRSERLHALTAHLLNTSMCSGIDEADINWKRTFGSGAHSRMHASKTNRAVVYKVYQNSNAATLDVEPVAFDYVNVGLRHARINAPLATCKRGRGRQLIQMQRRVPGVDLVTLIEEQSDTLNSTLQLRLVSQLAAAYAHLEDNRLLIQDLHPGNTIVDRSTWQLNIIDIDSMQRIPASCRCWPSNRCSGKIGCIFDNSNEALTNCGKAACGQATAASQLSQFVAYLYAPEAPGAVTIARASDWSNYSFDWQSDLIRGLSIRQHETVTTMRQVASFLRQQQHTHPPRPASYQRKDYHLAFKPFGYHVSDNPKTWDRMIQRWLMIYNEIRGEIKRQTSTFAVDWGSNEGFFSIALLSAFDNLHVFSVDPNERYQGVRPMRQHSEHLQRHLGTTGRLRSHLCQGALSINATYSIARPFTYQLALSIFHWLPMGSPSEFRAVLARLLLNARTTFIELPEPGHRVSANYKVFKKWYARGDDLQMVIQRALLETHEGALFSVRDLGKVTIDYGPHHPSTTTRHIYRVDVFSNATWSVDKSGDDVIALTQELERATRCSPWAAGSGV